MATPRHPLHPTSPHRSVMPAEVLEALQPRAGGVYVDGTLGAGGHAEAVLEASAPDGRLVGLDADPAALDLAAARLRRFGARVRLEHANYRDLEDIVMTRLGIAQVDGVLLDLGVSSMQLDQAARGFSFSADGPLDMRMDPSQGQSAADLVNTLPETDLARIIFEYGEERFSRRIARAIVQRRAREPFRTTADLATVVAAAAGHAAGPRDSGRGPRIHPATRTFQALRIATNDELGGLRAVLPQALRVLRPGGRLAVISFHSLEDRIVKQFMQAESGRCVCPPQLPVCRCGAAARLRAVTRKPLTASEAELQENPRSRSAKLRVAEKLAVGSAS